jgi:hypothetical protein
MPSTKRRDHKSRSFRGESLGARIVDLLNGENDLSGRKRVLSLLADATEMLGHAKRTPDGLFQITDSHQFRTALERFSRKLDRYKIVSAFSFHSEGRWYFTELFRGSAKHSLGEFLAVRALVTLSKEGLLDRVRQCEYCHEWFFALFSHQRCCGAPRDCRVRLHHSSEDYKRERREYAKEAYRQKKERERRLVERARKAK